VSTFDKTARALAQALWVSHDELLGAKLMKEGPSPKTAPLLKRLTKVEALPAADRRAVPKLVDALLETGGVARSGRSPLERPPGANGQGLGQNRGRAPARAPISAHLLAQRRRLGNWCR